MLVLDLKTLDVAMTGVSAALYAAFGYLSYAVLPVLAPVVGIVRFWPVVFIPAVFASLFGPLVGGTGAAIGIFISDVLIHGDPVLSLTVGVPSNFLAFYLLGLISRKGLDWKNTVIGMGIGCSVLVVTGYLMVDPIKVVDYFERLGLSIAISDVTQSINLIVGTFIFTYVLLLVVGYLKPTTRDYGIGSVVGLIVGSAIIGAGIWLYSQVFVLPAVIGGGFELPYYSALILFVWTFITEIPFLVILGPPILEACYKAFPALKPKKGKSELPESNAVMTAREQK
jgi:hypothetical protein